MNRRFSILVGILLILMGVLSLAFTLGAPLIGFDVWRSGAWRLWPLIVVGGGVLFVAAPLLMRGRRGLGGLFIPGVPVLATGGILLFCSIFDAWYAWEWLWPLEVLGLSLGFMFAAIYMRAIWLLLPTFVLGGNGLLMLFCAVTGLWDVWAILWTIEPLAVGLAFLVINLKRHSRGLFIAGMILCAVAALGLIGMSAIFPEWWLINAVGPCLLLLVGLVMLLRSLRRRPAMTQHATAE